VRRGNFQREALARQLTVTEVVARMTMKFGFDGFGAGAARSAGIGSSKRTRRARRLDFMESRRRVLGNHQTEFESAFC